MNISSFRGTLKEREIYSHFFSFSDMINSEINVCLHIVEVLASVSYPDHNSWDDVQSYGKVKVISFVIFYV